MQIPWHCLVCCPGFGGSDLPERALNFWTRRETMPTLPERSHDYPNFELSDTTRSYVRQLLAGQHVEIDDPYLSRVTVFKEPEAGRDDIHELTGYDR
jgi:hypothetical protein